MNSGQACRPYRGSCSPIPGRCCFGDLPGDEIVASPPSPIVEPLRCAVYLLDHSGDYINIYILLTKVLVDGTTSTVWNMKYFPTCRGVPDTILVVIILVFLENSNHYIDKFLTICNQTSCYLNFKKECQSNILRGSLPPLEASTPENKSDANSTRFSFAVFRKQLFADTDWRQFPSKKIFRGTCNQTASESFFSALYI